MPDQKKKNTGKNYEILTQRIFQKIVDQQFVKNIEVKHNVVLKGKTSNHQIDVFWEYEINGRLYQTIIQTKDWASKVKLAQLLTLKGVLVDLPGQPKGVFVTKTGYQSGASEYAEKNGIMLFELREPRDEDFEGQISVVNTGMRMSSDFRFDNLEIEMDKEWVRNELSKMQHKGEYTFKLSGDYKNTILYDENDVEIGSLYDLFSSDAIQINSSQLVTKKFDNAFIKTPSEKIEKIKISEIKCQVSRFEYDSNIEINLDKLIEFILKNVSKNETQYVFKEKNSE